MSIVLCAFIFPFFFSPAMLNAPVGVATTKHALSIYLFLTCTTTHDHFRQRMKRVLENTCVRCKGILVDVPIKKE